MNYGNWLQIKVFIRRWSITLWGRCPDLSVHVCTNIPFLVIIYWFAVRHSASPFPLLTFGYHLWAHVTEGAWGSCPHPWGQTARGWLEQDLPGSQKAMQQPVIHAATACSMLFAHILRSDTGNYPPDVNLLSTLTQAVILRMKQR